jgi:hypothetical protein
MSSIGLARSIDWSARSFEMLTADIFHYEKTGVLHVIGPLAGNDNSAI